ncbi:MAG TPA: DUF5591 domain-containing protein [Thermoplasmata archaeon]|nr:DUF5591 domain-containing protein [Thermoplasmata archaeon]
MAIGPSKGIGPPDEDRPASGNGPDKMRRTIESLEGLAIAGGATIGPLALRLPAILHARGGTPATAAPGEVGSLVLSDRGGARPGRRALSISDGVASLPIDFSVPAPEVSGPAGGASPVGPGTWMLRWPPSETDWSAIEAAHPELILLANARTLFAEGEPFVRAVAEVRTRLGAAPIVWGPRIAVPGRLALLAYAGIDLVDDTEALLRSSEGEFLTPELGPFDRVDLASEGACPCPACASAEPVESGAHARWAMDREHRLVRAAIRSGRLRELVEARLATEPLLAEILRYSDRLLGELLDERSPVTGGPVRGYVLRESFRRPEVRRFRRRLLARYRPPESKEVLLIVPCSRTKPYRASRSHRQFARALEGLSHLSRVEVASVTSPLGIVPRELEDMPPARHYDIPVTGEWDEAERAAVLEALSHLWRVGRFRSVVVHLDPEEYGFLRPALLPARTVTWTLTDGRTTSPAALAALREAVDAALSEGPAGPGGALPVVREELEAIAAFQFGADAARLLFREPLRLQGRPWFQRITDGRGTDLATLREERGLFQLTVAGAARMLPAHPLEVEVRPELPLTGDLFTPGVARADPAIRIGDAVLVVESGRLRAVGEAALPGRLMTDLPHGLAVGVRHRARAEEARGSPTAT